jgi:HAMP domain-containing protein
VEASPSIARESGPDDEAPAARSRFAVRAPLLAKLLASYLVVLGLVLVPAFLILRSRAESDVRGALSHELSAQVALVAARLGQVPDGRLPDEIEQLLRNVPVRVTVVDPSGRVLGDSVAPGAAHELNNHLGRPEIQQALRGSSGAAIRHSATTEQTMIYAAHRFPERGPARGVVRLAVPTSRADRAVEGELAFLDKAGAAALSVALVLSLVAAILVSRPLRRIARGARALAAGDLGHVVEVRSRDELGEVASALEELAGQLRRRLLESGADRVILRALLDDLPVGAILYGADRVPQLVNGAARSLLALSPATELDDARRLVEQPDQAQVVADVLAGGPSREHSLAPPWRKQAKLRGRWIAAVRADGGAQPILLLWPDEPLAAHALAEAAARWSDLLRQAVPEMRDAALARKLAQALAEMERAAEREQPAPDQVEAAPLVRLCEQPLSAARAQAEAGVAIALELPEPDVLVVESGGRVEAALRRLLSDAVAAGQPGTTLHLRGEQDRTRVRLTMRVRAPARGSFKTKWVASQVACLGGEAGATRDGDELELWLSLARA